MNNANQKKSLQVTTNLQALLYVNYPNLRYAYIFYKSPIYITH